MGLAAQAAVVLGAALLLHCTYAVAQCEAPREPGGAASYLPIHAPGGADAARHAPPSCAAAALPTSPPQISAINLAGIDRVIAVFAAGDTEDSLLLRQYRLRLKKGAHPRVPRAALQEMGPSLDLVVRRSRLPGVDMEKEALKRPQLGKKKVGPLGWLEGRRAAGKGAAPPSPPPPRVGRNEGECATGMGNAAAHCRGCGCGNGCGGVSTAADLRAMRVRMLSV
jgi:hypothetical protein